MPTYEYVALAADGRKSNGVVTADNARAARRELRFRSLTPLTINEANERKASDRKSGKPLTSFDRVLATRQLAMMISSGVQVEQALGAISSQAEKPNSRRLFAAMRDKVAEGHKFSDTVAEHPKSFPPLYMAVTSAGEMSGELAIVLERLAEHLEKSQKVRRKVLTAMIYPIVLGVVALLVIGLLLTFVVPRVVEQFQTFGEDLPLLTRIVIGMSDGLQNYGLILTGGLVLAIVGLRRFMRQRAVKRRVDAVLLNLPIAGKLIRLANSAQFARTFSMLIGSGTPVVDSLKAARGSLGNLVFAEAIDKVIIDVQEGTTPARALAKTGVFPPMLTGLVASSTASDSLANLLEKGAGYLEDEFDSSSSILLGLLEPLIILILGTIVALIVLSIMLPIMQLNTLAFS